jgi:hypothetical protein
MTTMQQTIDIPLDRHLHLDLKLPETVATGKAHIAVSITHGNPNAYKRHLGTLEGKGSVKFAPDYKMTEEELAGL